MGDKSMFDDFRELLTHIGVAAGFAALCGAAGYINKQMKRRLKIEWKEALLRAFTSGVTGVILMMACQATGLSQMWTGAIVGMAGWLGADATMAIVKGIIKQGRKS